MRGRRAPCCRAGNVALMWHNKGMLGAQQLPPHPQQRARNKGCGQRLLAPTLPPAAQLSGGPTFWLWNTMASPRLGFIATWPCTRVNTCEMRAMQGGLSSDLGNQQLMQQQEQKHSECACPGPASWHLAASQATQAAHAAHAAPCSQQRRGRRAPAFRPVLDCSSQGILGRTDEAVGSGAATGDGATLPAARGLLVPAPGYALPPPDTSGPPHVAAPPLPTSATGYRGNRSLL